MEERHDEQKAPRSDLHRWTRFCEPCGKMNAQTLKSGYKGVELR